MNALKSTSRLSTVYHGGTVKVQLKLKKKTKHPQAFSPPDLRMLLDLMIT